jgi:hypothetical protein
MTAQSYFSRARRCAHFAVALSAVAGIPAAAGQSLPFSGPTQGLVFDAPSRSLRQVAGTFGAASLGSVVAGDLDFASVAPQGAHGIACAEGQCFLLSELQSGIAAQSPLPGDWGTPAGATWSPEGSVAVLYSSAGQWIRVVRGLPEAVDAQPQWSLTSIGGTLSSVAVSAGGEHVIFAIIGDHAGVYELTPSGNFVPVLVTANPAAVAFALDGKTLLAADASARTVSEVTLSSGLVQTWSIDAVQDATGLQSGRDESGQAVVFIADRAGKAIFAYGTTSHAISKQIELAFAPTQISAMGSGGFQLTSRTTEDDLVWSYAPGRGAYFVPVTPTEPAKHTETTGPTQRRRR